MNYIKIAENHIESRKTNNFTPVDYSTTHDMIQYLNGGHTYEFILNRIEDTMIHPSDLFDAHNGRITSRYRDMVILGFHLFTTKLQAWNS